MWRYEWTKVTLQFHSPELVDAAFDILSDFHPRMDDDQPTTVEVFLTAEQLRFMHEWTGGRPPDQFLVDLVSSDVLERELRRRFSRRGFPPAHGPLPSDKLSAMVVAVRIGMTVEGFVASYGHVHSGESLPRFYANSAVLLPIVAVMVSRSDGSMPPQDLALISDYLFDSVQALAEGCYKIVVRDTTDRILRSLRLERHGRASESEEILEAGRLLSVDFILLARLSSADPGYHLSLRFVDARTLKIVSAVSDETCAIASLLKDLIPSSVGRVLSLPLRPGVAARTNVVDRALRRREQTEDILLEIADPHCPKQYRSAYLSHLRAELEPAAFIRVVPNGDQTYVVVGGTVIDAFTGEAHDPSQLVIVQHQRVLLPLQFVLRFNREPLLIEAHADHLFFRPYLDLLIEDRMLHLESPADSGRPLEVLSCPVDEELVTRLCEANKVLARLYHLDRLVGSRKTISFEVPLEFRQLLRTESIYP
jgi:hypothetical protein